jgi:glutathione S-transferase
MMKFYYSQLSPYARKCRILILEKGLSDKVEMHEAHPLDNAPELIAANPLGRVPALITEDGMALCESPVICEYLDYLSPKPRFIPESGMDRIDALALAALCDGIMDSAVACVLESRRPEDKRYPQWVERKENAAKRAVAQLASQLPTSEHFHIGVVGAIVALQYLVFRLPHIDWLSPHPQLAPWLATHSVRASVKQTAPA